MKWYFILLIVLAAGVVAFAVGRSSKRQVVDKDGKAVDGKFTASDDGKTATLKA